MGWLSGFGNVLGGVGSLASLFLDYPKAQEAADEVNRSQQEAIDQAGAEANMAYARGTEDLNKLYSGTVGEFAMSRDAQKANIQGWYDDYFNRGGMVGQGQNLANDRRNQFNQAWDASGLQNVQNAAQAELANMGAFRQGFADDRQVAGETLRNLQSQSQQVGKDFQEQLDRKTGALSEREKTLKEDLGGHEILAANATDREALTNLDQQIQQAERRFGPNDPRVMEMKAQQENLRRGMVDRTSQIIDKNQKTWLEGAAAFEADITNTMAAMGSTLSAMGGAQASIINTITQSRIGEAQYVNDTIDNAMEVGKTRFQAEEEMNNQVTGLMWDAIQADEKVRAFAMVDGPNTVISQAASQIAGAEAQYYQATMQMFGRMDAFTAMGIDMKYNKSPAVAYLGQFFGQGLGMVSQSFGMTSAYRQFGAQQHAQTQANALGWAGVGTSALNSFGPSFSTGPQGNSFSIG